MYSTMTNTFDPVLVTGSQAACILATPLALLGSGIDPTNNYYMVPDVQAVRPLRWGRKEKAQLIFFGGLFAFGLTMCFIGFGNEEHGRRYDSCRELPGNPDMFGIGIRCATYLQLTFAVVVQTFWPQYSKILAPTNLWFLFAYIIAINTIMWKPDTDVIDIYIGLALGRGITMVLLGPAVWLPPKMFGYEHQTTKLSRFLIWGLWKVPVTAFWFGIYWSRLKNVDPDDCGRFGWFFTVWWFDPNEFGTAVLIDIIFDAIDWFRWFYLATPPIFASLLLTVLVVLQVGPSQDEERLSMWFKQFHRTKPAVSERPSKFRVFLDCFNVFPIADVDWIIFGDDDLSKSARDMRREKYTKLECMKKILLGLMQPFAGKGFVRWCRDGWHLARMRFRDYLMDKYQIPGQLRHENINEASFQLFPMTTRAWNNLTGGGNGGAASVADMCSRWLWLIWDMWGIVFTVMTVEATIIYNKFAPAINAMNTAGQVIAMLVGVGACTAVLMKMSSGARQEKYGNILHPSRLRDGNWLGFTGPGPGAIMVPIGPGHAVGHGGGPGNAPGN